MYRSSASAAKELFAAISHSEKQKVSLHGFVSSPLSILPSLPPSVHPASHSLILPVTIPKSLLEVNKTEAFTEMNKMGMAPVLIV